jgi:TetR/AcrR family transcriptional regulator of autoinduction and epiphytic fitness
MPRNHRDIDSAQKREAILAVAHRLFQTEGYDGTGMARIAKEASLAPNTLYWYFDDKDALLVAILDRMIEDGLREYVLVQTKPMHKQLSWVLAQFEKSPGLIATVHARVPVSPAVREWHDRFHRAMEALVLSELGDSGVPEAQRPMAARLASFVLEGLLSHPTGPNERDAILRFVAGLVKPTPEQGRVKLRPMPARARSRKHRQAPPR